MPVALHHATPEIALLLACARSNTSQAAEQVGVMLQRPIDWNATIELAERHGILPLLHRGLKLAPAGSAPDEVMEVLREAMQAGACENLFQISELLRILQLLDAQRIPAIPFKGFVLAAAVYGDVALRQAGDLDIFLRREDLDRARDILLRDRYYLEETNTSASEHKHLRQRDDWKLIRDDERVVVELQCGVFRWPIQFPRNYERLWQGLEADMLFGVPVRSFLPEDLIMYLCVHGSKHLWERLIWVCDIAAIIAAHPGLRWQHIEAEAAAAGCTRMLQIGLLVAHYLLAAPVPAEYVRTAEANATVQLLAQQTCRRLLGELTPTLANSSTIPLFYLRMLDRADDRMRLLARLFANDKHFLHAIWRYGPNLSRQLKRM